MLPEELFERFAETAKEDKKKTRNNYKGLYQAAVAQLRSMGINSDSLIAGFDDFDKVED